MIYMRAFWKLTTERQIGFSLGPIPHSAVEKYGLDLGLGSDMLGAFCAVIRAMDDAFLKYAAKKQKTS